MSASFYVCEPRSHGVDQTPSVFALHGYEHVAGGRTILFAGGMPLYRDGVLVGAVGVSGGDSVQDQRACDAGVAAFEAGPGS
jgi:uncharacterized protein GlcG (DUF336 family)